MSVTLVTIAFKSLYNDSKKINDLLVLCSKDVQMSEKRFHCYYKNFSEIAVI